MTELSSGIIFVLAMISLVLSLATVKKNKVNAEVTMKLHIFLIQAVVVLSILVMAFSGFAALKSLLVVGC